MSDEVRRTFANRINYYLKANGLTQQDLANALKVSTSTVSDWCLAKKMPRMDKVQALASLFNIEMTDLLDESAPIISGKRRALYDRIDNATDEQIDKLSQIADVLFNEDIHNL